MTRRVVPALKLAAPFVLFFFIGSVVRAPYRDAFFWADDLDWLMEIGRYRSGKLAFWRYLCVPSAGAHITILDKLAFYLNWFFFRFETNYWKLSTEVVHASSALLLFVLFLPARRMSLTV